MMSPNCCCSDPECRRYGCKAARQQWVCPPLGRNYPSVPVGCICPPTSEQTCQAPGCPRKPLLAQGMPAMPETGTGSAAKQGQPGPTQSDAPNLSSHDPGAPHV
jgi:hypothetical protein